MLKTISSEIYWSDLLKKLKKMIELKIDLHKFLFSLNKKLTIIKITSLKC